MKKIIASIVVAVAAALTTANLPADTRPNRGTVQIDNFSFTPQTLIVPAGTKVTWVNKDDVPHTVTSTEKKFKSQVLDTDEQFSYTFSVPGMYPYFCTVHPHMTGTIVVK